MKSQYFLLSKRILKNEFYIIIFDIITHFLNMTTYYASARQTSEQDDYYFLQPMFQKHPPNEIISQRYAPDVTTQVKLVSKDERKNNLQYVPPKTKNAELENYAQHFNVFDYLGNAYASHINQIVYFKFNNAKYNLMPEAKLKTRVMPAFYVPFQQLYSQQESFFSKNMGLNFPETSTNCYLPTAKENKGCSFDPIFCSNFESGNLFAAIRKCPFEYDLILQNDVNSCEAVGWFNFSVQFLQQGYYSFRIVNLTIDMAKIFERGMKISYCVLNPLVGRPSKKSGEGWGLCGQNIKFSKSSIQRQNKKGEFYYELYFEFKCKNKHDIIMFALQVPYGSLETEIFFNKILFKKIKTMFKVEKSEYGKTISGSPLVAYHVARKKPRGESIQVSPISTQTILKEKRRSINLSPINRTLTIDNHNKSIIILGRIGSSDISGSFIMEGMVDYLMDNVEFESMKRVFDFYFVPLVNIDGARYGNTLTNLTGSVLNNNWKMPHQNYQAEIYSLKQFLIEVNKEAPISLIINLNTENEDIYSSVMGVLNEQQDVEDSRIFPFVLSKRNRLVSFEKSVFFKKNENNSMCCVLNQLFSKALIYELNVSHFQLMKRNDDIAAFPFMETEVKQCSPESYRLFGKDLLANYLEHVKIYDKNILLKEKWLKEIEEIEQSISKRQFVFVEDSKVEEKFPEAFYEVQNLRKITEVKSAKTMVSYKLLNPPKTFDIIDRSGKDAKKKQKNLKNSPVCSVNDFASKRNQQQGYLKNKIPFKQENKKVESDVTFDKPISLFRIAQKKTSVLLNCPSNTLNLQVEGETRLHNNQTLKDKSLIEKQILKKELSTKMLKKMKIEDTVKGWKGKDKFTDARLGENLINS